MAYSRWSRGSALLMVVLFIFLLSVTGLAILYMNGRQEMVAVTEIREMAAYQAAQTGFELARAWFVSINTFPELHTGTTFPIQLFVDASHPDGTWVLSTNPQNPGQGTSSYRVRVDRCADNNVNIAGGVGVIGNYVVISSGIVSTGVPGSYDYIKVTSATIRARMSGGMRFRVVDRSWVEEPMKRVLH